MPEIRDSNVSRNYRALKLALWLTERKYWQGGLTERQTLWLIERALNHPEVLSRWGDINVTVEFADRGTTAWAIPGRHPQLHLPMAACTPLIVLHEVAHLLKATRREAHHGPGFTAIHLMLIELLKPKLLQPMLAAYHATCTPWDASRIPPGAGSYIPLVGSVEIVAARHHLQALVASGRISERERRNILATLRKAPGESPAPMRSLPHSVLVSTEALLACNTDADIARLVLDALAADVMPREFKRPKKKGKKPGSKTGDRRSARR